MSKTSKFKPCSVAIIGATGVVGRELIRILEEGPLLITKLKLFASERSAGELLSFRDEDVMVQVLSSAEQIDTDIAFFAAGSKVSKQYIETAAANGTTCIDKSSAFRLDKDVPLIVAGVNSDILKDDSYKIIASPNCVATPLCQVLSPIEKMAGISQVIAVSLQAVSGAGKEGSDELESQIRDLFNLREIQTEVFGQRIAFNALPFVPARSAIDALGKTEEEAKVIEETKKILTLPKLKMDITCVRVPVFNGHSLAVHIATERPIDFNALNNTLKNSPGIMIVDEPKKGIYPTPLMASGQDVTFVGRLRKNTAAKNGISLFLASDNLRTGAALNAARIAEIITME
jgi:aspartate-semialdehyde dehydrogenase